jgi:septal ring factor EnvC (AmiA/AmiB activator)
MKRIHIDIKVLLLLTGFVFQGHLQADTVLNSSSTATSGGVYAADDKAQREMAIDRLRQDVARGKAEKEAISDQNSELHSRMKELESKILELRKQALDQNDAISKPEVR